MPISNKIIDFMDKGSWIRKMFEEGIALKKQFGEENVFDLSLGNPVMEPPEEFFDELKYIAKRKELKFSELRYGAVTKFNFKGRVFIFLKPSTYVNKSGDAVKYWMAKEKINLQNLLVICDDLNIPFGSIRIKTKGSDGGHNGLKDLESKLGTSNYGRLRFGIKNETKQNTTQFVLDKWNQNELDVLETYFIKTEKAIFSYTLLGPSNAMNNFNN